MPRLLRLFAISLTIAVSWRAVWANAATNEQIAIPAVERMPRVPTPLSVRDWGQVARSYYRRVLDPKAVGDSFPVVSLPDSRPGFLMKSYIGGKYDSEAFAGLLSVVGAQLVGLDTHKLNGVDYSERAKSWYDPQLGIYRHRIGESSSVVHADIYGYWPAIQGLMLAAQSPRDEELQHQARTTFEAFNRIARGLGCPTHPDFNVLGWDFAKGIATGRPEPMNRLGHAPSVAWVLMAGAQQTGNREMLENARAAMHWYVEHPGRYEMSHVMGPLTAARLNVQDGANLINMDRVLAAWFGDGPVERFPWSITAGTQLNGLTCDGLDGARWDNNGFYAFTMGSLQGPAWLVPVVRYDQRYARAIARYALNAANSARLLQGEDLDSAHQDHAAWKAQWDRDNLLFYEGLASQGPGNANTLRPYARGDVVLNGWSTGRPAVPPDEYLQQRGQWFGATPDNLALYMGSSVGFLGGIEAATNVPAILRWDCTATDWFHPPAYPTHLLYNPTTRTQKVRFDVSTPTDLYDAVSGRFVARAVRRQATLRLQVDEAAVIVQVPPKARLERRDGKLWANGVVINYRSP